MNEVSQGRRANGALSFLLSVALLLLLSAGAAALRQALAPRSIAWNGKWPTQGTPAQDAYKLMARPTDPPFASLADTIDLHERKAATFLDARSAELYKAGHIPGARSLPYYELDAYSESALKGLTDQSPIVIYCEGISCELSFLLGRELQTDGYKNIKIFYGGWPEWSEAGLAVEK